MRNPSRRRSNISPPATRESKLVKCIASTSFALIVLLGIAVLISWVIVRPKRLVYTIADGSVHGFDLKDKYLNASFYFMLKVHNPNDRISVFYDFMRISVLYEDELIAFEDVKPFYQPYYNVTVLELKPVAHSAALKEPEMRDLKLERSSGAIELTVEVKARVRIKVGSLISRERKLWTTCYPVDLQFSSSPKSFETIRCASHI